MRLLTGDDTGLLKVLDSKTGKVLQVFGSQLKVNGVLLIENFKECVSSCDVEGDDEEEDLLDDGTEETAKKAAARAEREKAKNKGGRRDYG